MHRCIDYKPSIIDHPNHININSSWGNNIPTIIKDIIVRFNIDTPKCALEFGVEFGYSTSVLACYFEKVIGVDTFEGDIHSGVKINHFNETKKYLMDYPNIELIQSDYKSYIKKDENIYDLIHIDIVHSYNETFECGEWSVLHSDVVIFHDTLSFSEINIVCHDLSRKYDLIWYNYNKDAGLGILVNKKRF